MDNLKAWVNGLLPTGISNKATIVSAGTNGDAFSNLSVDEFNVVSAQITHHPNDFTWVAAIRKANFVVRGCTDNDWLGCGASFGGKTCFHHFFDA